ncbi:transmembrane secretion effector [Stackebrandtia albiflava]|uniref:Transmembrane secretion effector n=1 Tax=Stackebrandtia albiflava TaxID=406432 RepID=A0A562V536_9ACTN|nr:MFS transporter [Stackebrandtia albiflava]TWJ12942.1 transmembrane secretion effector [Stackebrandtia albiflava]
MRSDTLHVLRQRDFALLWWGGLVSFLGNWTLRVALPVTVLELTGSTAALAATTAAGLLPALLIGPLVGVYVDRWDRKRVMVVGNLVQAAVLAPLLLVDSASEVWIVVVVALVSAGVSPFCQIAENALLPRLVPRRHLLTANSLNAVNNNLARFVGPVLGGTLAVTVGLPGVVVLDAATYLVAAGFAALVSGGHRPAGVASAAAGPVRRVAREMREGFSTIVSDGPLRVVFGMVVLIGLGEGVMATVFVVFVEQEIAGGAAAYGWLVAAQAVGGVCGGLAGGRFAARFSERHILGFGLVALGCCDLFTFNYPQWYSHVWPGLAAMIVVGLPSALSQAALTTVVQTRTPDRLRGRVFAVRGAVMAGFMIVGTGLAAASQSHLDVVTVLSLQALTPIAAGSAALVLLRTTGHPEQPSPIASPERVARRD